MKSIGLWVLVVVLLIPEVLSLDVEKLSYVEGELIRVNEMSEYCGVKGYSFTARLDCNRVVSENSEKLVYVSDGKTVGTVLNLGVFGGINLFIVKIVKKCFRSFL